MKIFYIKVAKNYYKIHSYVMNQQYIFMINKGFINMQIKIKNIFKFQELLGNIII